MKSSKFRKGVRNSKWMFMKILYEDNFMIIVDKPSGQLVQSGKSFDMDLTSEVLNYRKQKKEIPYAAVINRLDRPVSGLVLFAKDKKSAAKYSKILEQQGINKHYICAVCGYVQPQTGTMVDYLLKDAKENCSKVVRADKSGAKKAVLNYRVINYHSDWDCTFLDVELITGRHHQIRTQFSSRGHVLAGDYKYLTVDKENKETCAFLAEKLNLKKNEIALCAYSIEILGNLYKTNPDWAKYITSN